MKTCSACLLLKELSCFGLNKGGKFGRNSVCKDCANARSRKAYDPAKKAPKQAAYYEANKAEILERTSAWAKANREKTRKYCQDWRAANPEKQRAATLAWRAANPQAQALHYRENDFRRRAAGYSPKRAELRAAINQCKESYRIGDKYLDAYTMELIDEPTIDHIIPLSQGGRNELENFVVTSRQNNSRKRTRSAIAFLFCLAVRGYHVMGTTSRPAI